MDQEGLPDLQGHLEELVLLDRLGRMDSREIGDRMDRQVHLEELVKRELLVRPELVDRPDPQDLQGSKVDRDL